MISSRWREKGHRMLRNHQTLTNLIIFREIVQPSHLDEEQKDIGCCEIIKHWRISSSSEKLFNHLISMKSKRTSDVDQSSHIDECDDDERNCSMISSRWREKGHRMLVNHHTLMNVMMMREIVQWSDLDEEKKDMGCWSMMKHWRMLWWWEKLFDDFISMKRKRTSDVGQWSNIGECVHCQRNCSMISSRWREEGHRMLFNDETLANVTLLREIVQWSDLAEEKKDIGCWSMIKHCRMCSS